MLDLFIEKIIGATDRFAYVTAYRGYFPDLQKHVLRRNNIEGSYYNDISIKQMSKKLSAIGLQEQEYSFYSIKVADEGRDDWLIAAHITDTSLKNVNHFASYAESIGFDLLILAAPYFVTRKEEQVLEFVKAVADNTDLAIMFYNSPQFGIVLDENWLGKLCQISNVVGVKEASFNKDISINTHLNVGSDAIISTPDEWILFAGDEIGFQQQVMFANTSDWRFDKQGSNHYVSFVERAMSGDLDKAYYEKHVKPIKAISDNWWQRVVAEQKGAMPVPVAIKMISLLSEFS